MKSLERAERERSHELDHAAAHDYDELLGQRLLDPVAAAKAAVHSIAAARRAAARRASPALQPPPLEVDSESFLGAARGEEGG